jgi:hypothetical protein
MLVKASTRMGTGIEAATIHFRFPFRGRSQKIFPDPHSRSAISLRYFATTASGSNSARVFIDCLDCRIEQPGRRATGNAGSSDAAGLK